MIVGSKGLEIIAAIFSLSFMLLSRSNVTYRKNFSLSLFSFIIPTNYETSHGASVAIVKLSPIHTRQEPVPRHTNHELQLVLP